MGLLALKIKQHIFHFFVLKDILTPKASVPFQ